MKKPSTRPKWDEFQQADRPEFSDKGDVYGRVESYLEAWQAIFDGKFVGVGATKEEAKQKVEDAYEHWLERERR